MSIKDRIRAATLAIASPLLMSNDGRHYVIPSLLDQLRDHTGTGGTGSAADSGSRPPIRLDGVSILDLMSRRVSAYLAVLGMTAASLRDGLLKLSDTLTDDNDPLALAYVGELEHWQAIAESLTGPPPYIPHIACPVESCGRWSSIHIGADLSAFCVACGAAWPDARSLVSDLAN